ncbi:MAG: CoA pyrophosphatase [Candidatus Rokubacteria bacterium]|nr:CoA pyrophosphatase [Candidatus Rokubacteria bacterium]
MPGLTVTPDLDRVRRALAGTPLSNGPPEGKQAAVALVLAGEAADLHVCLIERAEHERDRWSGHMALPGGRVEATDASARAAAIRETWEEVGLRLEACLGETLEPFTPSDEVAQAFWVPLRHLLEPGNAAFRPTPRDGVVLESPAVRYQDRFIWGLTYRVLTRFFAVMELTIARPR